METALICHNCIAFGLVNGLSSSPPDVRLRQFAVFPGSKSASSINRVQADDGSVMTKGKLYRRVLGIHWHSVNMP